MKMVNIKEWLFGIDLQFEDIFSKDDCLRSLSEWPMILFRNKRQMNIFIAALCLISMNQISFIIYIIFWRPELQDVVAMLPSESLILGAQLFMISLLKVKSFYMEWMEHIKIVLENNTSCSEEIKSRIESQSNIMKLQNHFTIFMVIINFILYAWRGGDSKHFFPLFLMEKLGKGVVYGIIFCVLFSYVFLAASNAFTISTYACGHIYFQLLILRANLEKLNCKYTENENYQLHNIQYQKMIKRKLMSCWKHYLNIRRLKSISSELSYWPIYLGYIVGILLLGTVCTYFLFDGYPSENPGMVFTAVLVLPITVVISENGQSMKSESQNMHNTLLRTQWYQWNRENRKFLLMFLIATQEPLQHTSFGIDQSREMYGKVFKGIYSATTCINSLRN